MSENCSHNCAECGSECSERTAPQSMIEPLSKNSSVKKVIGVVSGKRDVRKSLITSMLAVLPQRKGYQAAILDADITGSSSPKCLGFMTELLEVKKGFLPSICCWSMGETPWCGVGRSSPGPLSSSGRM